MDLANPCDRRRAQIGHVIGGLPQSCPGHLEFFFGCALFWRLAPNLPTMITIITIIITTTTIIISSASVESYS